MSDEPGGGGPNEPSPALPDRLTVQLDWWSVVVVLAIATAALAGWRLVALAPEVTTVVVVAVFVSLALDPLVAAVAGRLRLRRGAAAALVLTAGLAVAAGFAVLVGPDVVEQSERVGRDLPRTIDSLGDLPLVGERLRDAGVVERLRDGLQTLPETLAGRSSDLGELIGATAAGLAWFVVGVLLVAGALADGPDLVRRVRGIVPAANRATADELGRVVYDVLARYFAGSLLLAFLHGLWVTAAGILAGVPLAPVLGVWTAVTSLIPQIGGLLGFVLVVVVSLSQGLGVTLFMALTFFVYMTFSNNVLEPILVGRAVRVSAPVTMLAAVAGFSVAGVVGSLLAVPTIGAIKAVASYLRHRGEPGVERPTPTTEGLHPLGGLTAGLRRLGRRDRGGPRPNDATGAADAAGVGGAPGAGR